MAKVFSLVPATGIDHALEIDEVAAVDHTVIADMVVAVEVGHDVGAFGQQRDDALARSQQSCWLGG